MTNREKGELPSTTEVNPKEQCNAITLRSGLNYEELSKLEKRQPVEKEEEDQDQQAQVQPQAEEQPEKEKSTEVTEEKKELPSYDHHIRIPFPQRLYNLDKQFAKFLEVFKKLHINIPFTEALEQMPKYVKFMKEILSKKRNWGTMRW